MDPAVDMDVNLPNYYEKLWSYFEALENSDEGVNSESVQTKVDAAITDCYEAIDMVNKLEIFSMNEEIDEITTSEIKYLLLPAFLGYFTNKKVGEERLEVAKKSRDCYKNFIKLCKTFGLTKVNVKSEESETVESGTKVGKTKPDSSELMKHDMARRQEKIERYKAKGALEKELKELFIEVKKEHVDEEMRREYYIKLVNKWIADSLDAIESIDGELPILEHIAKIKASSETSIRDMSCSGKECKKHSKKKFVPFIITKDELQKAVFGLGYPSMPTVTVDEFYEERVRQGLFPGPDAKPQVKEKDEEKEKEREAAEKERKEELDDDEAIMKARAWDEYRDDHRRGWGNTHNKG